MKYGYYGADWLALRIEGIKIYHVYKEILYILLFTIVLIQVFLEQTNIQSSVNLSKFTD